MSQRARFKRQMRDHRPSRAAVLRRVDVILRAALMEDLKDHIFREVEIMGRLAR